MKLELKAYGALCALEIFTINNIKAESNDFGEKYDHNPEDAEEYGCGNMRFDSYDVNKEVLEKYKISKDEYYEICDKLTEELSFGNCGWCV